MFGGGGAVTHYMLLHHYNDYDLFIYNELSSFIFNFFKDILSGLYSPGVYNYRYISRQEFYSLNDKDPFVSVVWSYSNSMSSYIYGKENKNENEIKREFFNLFREDM